MFSETPQKLKWEGRNHGFLWACLFFLWTTVWPLHFTGSWKQEPGIQQMLAKMSLWLSCMCYHQTRQQLIIKEKKPSPMISLTGLFCHRLIQNSFQVTWTTQQSGNVLAATKGTSIRALAVISLQYPQITALAIPLNILLIRKERSP